MNLMDDKTLLPDEDGKPEDSNIINTIRTIHTSTTLRMRAARIAIISD
jgi:hypothetical protein